MEITREIARVGPGTLTTESEDDNIFNLFRLVFAAERCRERKVYWVEERRGQMVLRQVLNPRRASKKEDTLIGLFPGTRDLDVVRLAIAAANTGKILTGVRWEIYGDFACTERLDMGRFDMRDLLPDAGHLRRIVASGTVSCSLTPDAWDFDGFLETHRCQSCNGWIRDALVFVPALMQCSRCMAQPNEQLQFVRVVNVLHRLPRRDDGVFRADRSGTTVYDFLDIHATAMFCWIGRVVLDGEPMARVMRSQRAHKLLTHLPPDEFAWCYRRSVFPLLGHALTREAFVGYVHAYYDRRIAAADLALPPDLGDMGIAYPPELKQEILEDFRKSYHKTREQFDRAMETLAGYGEWLFGDVEDRMVVGQRSRAIAKALETFAHVMHEIIEDVGRQLQKQERRIG